MFESLSTRIQEAFSTLRGEVRLGHRIRADAFLRGMVRRIVAALLEAGRGRLDRAALESALAQTDPAFGGAAAPARGLSLRRVALGRRQRRNGEHEAA